MSQEKCSYCGEAGHSIQNCPKWKGSSASSERDELIKRLRAAVGKLPTFTIKWTDVEKMSTSELREVVGHTEKQVATATKDELTPYMQEKIPLILSKLREAQKTMMVSKETLYDWVHPYVTKVAFDEIIAYLERKGEIFEPRPGFLKTTESSSVDWDAVWQKAMEKLKTDRSKVTDVARAEILSTATMASVPETFRTQIGRDLHIYPKYDAYAMWVNPKGGFLFFATPEEKSKIEHFLFAVGQFLDVIPPGAEFPEEGKKLELTDVTGWSREQIFNYVKNKENWKKPTNPIRVKAGQKEKVSEAICYYVGGVEFKDLKDGTWLITSRGYYYYIGA